jgi:hypothetical protein
MRIGGALLGLGLLAVTACTQSAEPDELAPTLLETTDDLDPQGKAPRTSAVTMTCVQATGGCTPVGYRNANCAMANLKPNTYVVTCVKAKCPAVYGFDNGRGESCFTPQKVALDGTAIGFFALLPDASYSITTYTSKNGAPGEVLASSSVSLASSVGEDTQCGGVPSGSCL